MVIRLGSCYPLARPSRVEPTVLTLRPENIIHKGRRPGVVRSTKNTNTVRLVLHVELLDVDLDNRLALRNVTSPPQYIRQKSM